MIQMNLGVIKMTKPLTDEEIQDFKNDELDYLLVEINGKIYNDEDLHRCAWCGFKTIDRFDLNDNMLCKDCNEEDVEWKSYGNYVRSIR